MYFAVGSITHSSLNNYLLLPPFSYKNYVRIGETPHICAKIIKSENEVNNSYLITKQLLLQLNTLKEVCSKNTTSPYNAQQV